MPTSQSYTKKPVWLNVRLCITLALAALLTACQPPNQGAGSAEKALQDYFAALSTGQYEQADRLYGGAYDTMAGWNPDIDPADHTALWEAGCSRNGLRCLPVRSLMLKGQDGDIYTFMVEFTSPDGTLFVRSPCCGADETQMPSTSQFEYRVQESAGGKFFVLDLPVYVP